MKETKIIMLGSNLQRVFMDSLNEEWHYNLVTNKVKDTA